MPRRRRRKYPRSATVSLSLIAKAVGLADAEAVAVVLQLVGLRVDQRGRSRTVTLSRMAARRLGLVQRDGRWRRAPGGPKPEDQGWPRGRQVSLDSFRALPADRRTQTPLDELIAAEDPPAGRIGNLQSWLDEWSQTGRRPQPLNLHQTPKDQPHGDEDPGSPAF